MKTRTTEIKWKAIALFYVIAVLIRAIVLRNEDFGSSPFSYWLWAWAEGIGPCVGALVAILVFRRRFYCTLTGRSLMKSVITVALPLVICFLLDRGLSLTLLNLIFYSLLEEVGWRGYLQGELKDMNPPLRVFVIGTMWFLWHITVGLNLASLAFYGVLLFGSWGIGNIARDTRSLIACACFHTLFNFIRFVQFTPVVIALYAGVFVSLLAIWYMPWKKMTLRLKQFIYKRP
ncbi:MAG: CPBP family intramembrane glutamic endopeptidase [Prevotella sp.]|nr:CPBP family intramembrane glutamic endopeptidase [Prevotella sp.]